MQSQTLTVAVTGAAGQIGYALLFRIASGQMFGPNTPVILHLLECESSLPALQGIIMELEDCAFPLLQGIMGTHDLERAMEGINWAILVGASPRRSGMERADLLKVNGGIFAAQGQAINRQAAQDVRVFVVGNPCNSNALIAMHHAPRVSQDRFYAMTLLDQCRARHQLAKKAGVSVDKVRRLAIWGNHSVTQYPDYFHATIEDLPVPQVILDENWLSGNAKESFIPQVQQRGALVIQARGASSAASAANAIVESVYALTHDTPAGDWFSVASCSQGEYGIEAGLIFSYPSRVDQGTLKVVSGIQHNAFSQAKLRMTLEELKEERDMIRRLGLI